MPASPLGWSEIFDQSKAGSDSVVPFLGTAQALAADARLVIEVGCGRGGAVDLDQARPFQDLRGPGRTVIGIDVDAVGVDNPVVDEFRLIDETGKWPLADGEVDLAVSDFVLEHVADPKAFVAELTRTLRPGGVLVARTISRYSPLSIAARAVPNARHARVLRRLQPTREARDVFPTQYRMNTRRDLAALLDHDYEWALAHRTGLDQYLLRWPALAKFATVAEPRLPSGLHTALVVFARKRG
ncbi:MAG TPA: class I SAM-dependent methyltransferase [Jatrophihabitantaceae bacterium]|jgi:SAM-dependent methyltransferase|nr:class I SAM-dependent methyltransferase [Jatrophihabitantaceae bacterium]